MKSDNTPNEVPKEPSEYPQRPEPVEPQYPGSVEPEPSNAPEPDCD